MKQMKDKLPKRVSNDLPNLVYFRTRTVYHYPLIPGVLLRFYCFFFLFFFSVKLTLIILFYNEMRIIFCVELTRYLLCFNFILGSNFISLCFKLIIIHYHTPKQREIKFERRIKLNHNISFIQGSRHPCKHFWWYYAL